MNSCMCVTKLLGWMLLAALLGWGYGHAAVEANHSPHEDLIAIKGIGPATSQRIVEARQQRPFSDWNDFIVRIRGIGPATALRLSDNGLTVNGLRMESQRPYSPSLGPLAAPVWHPAASPSPPASR